MASSLGFEGRLGRAILWGLGGGLLAMTGIACGDAEETATGTRLATTAQALTPQEAEIAAKWTAMGGAATVGAPLGPVTWLPEGLDGQYREYEHGVIVSSNDFGAFLLSSVVFAKYIDLRLQTDAYGTNLLSVVGLPLEDTGPVTIGGATRFARGQIVTRATGTFVIYGAIYAKYLALAPVLGLPLNDETSPLGIGDERYQSFDNGPIDWSASRGVFASRGPVLDRWVALGETTGALGFPISDTDDLVDAVGNVIGMRGRYAHGTIYYSPSTGTHVLPTKMAQAFDTLHGGVGGDLGFPVSDQGTSPASGFEYVDFQNGVLVDIVPPDPDPATIQAFMDFDFYVESFDSYGDDCWLGVCGSQDPYWTLKMVDENGDELFYGKWGNGGSPDWEVTEPYALANPTPRGASTYTVTFHAWDVDTGPNDTLGTIDIEYNIDNLWRQNMATEYDAGHGATGRFRIRNGLPVDREAGFMGNYWWSFNNPTTSDLTYTQFASTFDDVSNDEYAWAHPFNKTFYHLLYKGIASEGNCYGMSLESLYAQESRSPWRQPIFQYFDDTQGGNDLKPVDGIHSSMLNQLNIKQGYQLGLDSVLWAINAFQTGMTHDPEANFVLGLALKAKGDPTVVSVFSNYIFGKGHTLRVRDYEDGIIPGCNLSPVCQRIVVADPNNPYATPHPAGSFIEIDPISNMYRYHDGEYSGTMFTGGRLFVTPYSLVDDQPVTPFGIAQELLNSVAMVLTGSTGRVNQVTDDAGRALFAAPVSGEPQWDDLTQDAGQVLPTLAPVPLAMEAPMPGQFFAGRDVVGTSHDHLLGLAEGLPAGTPYEATVTTARLSSHLVVPGTPGVPDHFRALDIGTPTKAMEFELPANSPAKTIQWTVSGANKHRWTELSELTVVPGQRIRVHTERAGTRVVIENDGPPTDVVVRVNGGQGATPVDLGRIDLPSGVSDMDFRVPRTTLTLSGEVEGNDGWLTAPVQVTLSAVDFSGLGIEAIEYSLDGQSWFTYGGPFTYAGQGETELFFRARDNAAHQEPAQVHTFRIDSVVPQAQATSSSTDPTVVVFGAADAASGSGLLGVHALIEGDDGPVETFLEGSSGVIHLPSPCARLEVWAEDIAGNVQEPHFVLEDATAPTFTSVLDVVTSHCTASAGLLLEVGVTDNCGVASLTNDAPVQLPLGTTLVTWQASDAAGNVATALQMVTTELGDDPSCCPAGSNVVVGTSNDDVLVGTAGDDCILALGGQDRLYGLGGADALSGGEGDDQLWGAAGNDLLYGGGGQDRLYGETDNDTLVCGNGVDWAFGGPGDDALWGGQGGDHLYGESGNDSLHGEADDDQLDGGWGNDWLDGGLNHDSCVGGGGSDQCVQDGGDNLGGTCVAVYP